jgi:hypothetical protein
MHLIRQPEGGSCCGQACVAMAAGVTLATAISAVGHDRRRGTHTWELVAAFALLGVACAPRLRRTKHVAGMPVLPPRAIVAIRRDGASKKRWHWLLTWDGVIMDPAGLWPGFYGSDWRMTSHLQIHSGVTHRIALYFPVRNNAAQILLQQVCDVRENKAIWQHDEERRESRREPKLSCLTAPPRSPDRPVSSTSGTLHAGGAAAQAAAQRGTNRPQREHGSAVAAPPIRPSS